MLEMMPTDRESFEAEGEWWTPERPEWRVAGRLKFSPDSGVELRLSGGLRSFSEYGEEPVQGVVAFSEDSLERASTHDRILGKADGTRYTIESAMVVRTEGLLGAGRVKETLRAPLVYSGVWFGSGEAAVANEARFKMTHLQEWIGTNGLGLTIAPKHLEHDVQHDAPAFTIQSWHLPSRVAQTSAGGSVTLDHFVGVRDGRPDEIALTQRFSWALAIEDLKDVEELVEAAGDLQDLVSIGTQRTAELRAVRCGNPDLDRHVDGSLRRGWFGVHVHWSVEAEPSGRRRPRPVDLWFNLEQLGGIDGVARWQSSADAHRRALRRVMGTHYGHRTYLSDRLLNCAAALESFDRTLSNRPREDLKVRLKRCAELAGPPFDEVVADLGWWTEQVRVRRNDAAHQLEARTRTAADADHPLWRSLYLLFVLCMLRDAEADPTAFDQIGRHAELRRLKKELAALKA